MKLVPPTAEGIAAAASCIRGGGLVAYPTETVYGLAVDPFSVAAIEALFTAKGRATANPILLVAANIEQVQRVTAAISETAKTYMARYWPGPLSLVLPRVESLPADVCAGGPKVCVRVPACEIARALCAAVGHPITSTSANRSGMPAPSSPADIGLEGVAMCIDGGTLPPSPPSTVFDPDTGTVIREGAVPSAALVCP